MLLCTRWSGQTIPSLKTLGSKAQLQQYKFHVSKRTWTLSWTCCSLSTAFRSVPRGDWIQSITTPPIVIFLSNAWMEVRRRRVSGFEYGDDTFHQMHQKDKSLLTVDKKKQKLNVSLVGFLLRTGINYSLKVMTAFFERFTRLLSSMGLFSRSSVSATSAIDLEHTTIVWHSILISRWWDLLTERIFAKVIRFFPITSLKSKQWTQDHIYHFLGWQDCRRFLSLSLCWD